MTNETLLLRQVHPTWFQKGLVTSQAFRPTPKDEEKLSVYDGDLISAVPSYVHYTSRPSRRSIGVVGVSVAECNDCSLTTASDPAPFPEHAVIDFTGLPRKEVERRGKTLTAHAQRRGWLYEADGTS